MALEPFKEEISEEDPEDVHSVDDQEDIEDHEKHYGPAAVFKLFPDLCLDRLTFLAKPGPVSAYMLLQGMIGLGSGWKELHFITPYSEMLGYDFQSWLSMFYRTQPIRKPQPADWQEKLYVSISSESLFYSYHGSFPNCFLKHPSHKISLLRPYEYSANIILSKIAM